MKTDVDVDVMLQEVSVARRKFLIDLIVKTYLVEQSEKKRDSNIQGCRPTQSG